MNFFFNFPPDDLCQIFGGLILFDDINESYFLLQKFYNFIKNSLSLLGEVTWGAKIKSGFSQFLMNLRVAMHSQMKNLKQFKGLLLSLNLILMSKKESFCHQMKPNLTYHFRV